MHSEEEQALCPSSSSCLPTSLQASESSATLTTCACRSWCSRSASCKGGKAKGAEHGWASRCDCSTATDRSPCCAKGSAHQPPLCATCRTQLSNALGGELQPGQKRHAMQMHSSLECAMHAAHRQESSLHRGRAPQVHLLCRHHLPSEQRLVDAGTALEWQ